MGFSLYMFDGQGWAESPPPPDNKVESKQPVVLIGEYWNILKQTCYYQLMITYCYLVIYFLVPEKKLANMFKSMEKCLFGNARADFTG